MRSQARVVSTLGPNSKAGIHSEEERGTQLDRIPILQAQGSTHLVLSKPDRVKSVPLVLVGGLFPSKVQELGLALTKLRMITGIKGIASGKAEDRN